MFIFVTLSIILLSVFSGGLGQITLWARSGMQAASWTTLRYIYLFIYLFTKTNLFDGCCLILLVCQDIFIFQHWSAKQSSPNIFIIWWVCTEMRWYISRYVTNLLDISVDQEYVRDEIRPIKTVDLERIINIVSVTQPKIIKLIS